jgi:riboflavin kinase/FMN adenylyltransferase
VNIYFGFEEVKKIRNAVVTTGSFDGVHLGHKLILKRLRDSARKIDGETVLITFYPHPRQVLYPNTSGKDLLMINSQQEKIDLLREAGLDNIIFVKFTREFASTSAKDFIEKFLVNQLHVKKIITGENHHFGKNREGDIEELRLFGLEHNFEIELIPSQDIQNVDVSSTLIRESLLQGQVQKAKKYLGHPFFIKGKIQAKGQSQFLQMGYKTKKLLIEDKFKLLPPCGSYLVWVDHFQKTYRGLCLITFCSETKENMIDIYAPQLPVMESETESVRVHFLKPSKIENNDALLKSAMIKDLIHFNNLDFQF